MNLAKNKPPYSDGFKSSYGSEFSAFAIANRLRADILPGSDLPVSTACICVTDTPDRPESWRSVMCWVLRCSRMVIQFAPLANTPQEILVQASASLPFFFGKIISSLFHRSFNRGKRFWGLAIRVSFVF